MIESIDDGNKGKQKNQTNSQTPVLDNFSRDLIKLAQK